MVVTNQTCRLLSKLDDDTFLYVNLPQDLIMKCLPALLSAILLLAACSPDEDAVQPPLKKRKVLVVGWDGVRSDAVQKADTPVLDDLAAGGAFTFKAITQTKAETSSSPGWLAILTGVQSDKNLVESNFDFFDHDHAYPSFLRRAKADFGLTTASSCDWELLCSVILKAEKAYDVSKEGDEEKVTAAMENWLLTGDYDVHFMHLDLPDHEGHTTGFDPENALYIEKIEQSDALTGRLVKAIASRPTRADEEWLIVVVTDHGGEGTNHGPKNAANQTIFVVMAGDGLVKGELPAGVTQMDIHPTVMRFLRKSIKPEWKLDGQVVGLTAK